LRFVLADFFYGQFVVSYANGGTGGDGAVDRVDDYYEPGQSFKGLPTELDCALTHPHSGYYLFFRGDRMWAWDPSRAGTIFGPGLVPGYPQAMVQRNRFGEEAVSTCDGIRDHTAPSGAFDDGSGVGYGYGVHNVTCMWRVRRAKWIADDDFGGTRAAAVAPALAHM
jgi:hypothetical protein